MVNNILLLYKSKTSVISLQIYRVYSEKELFPGKQLLH